MGSFRLQVGRGRRKCKGPRNVVPLLPTGVQLQWPTHYTGILDFVKPGITPYDYLRHITSDEKTAAVILGITAVCLETNLTDRRRLCLDSAPVRSSFISRGKRSLAFSDNKR